MGDERDELVLQAVRLDQARADPFEGAQDPDEPQDDEYPINDPQLDLVYWSVQVVKR